ncbi:hypothetical protein AMECASPLE_015191 [Ameca splendens]|uniref:Uncharacterized protein n=1 Tax=Ameca splendens TaxID=208324 RepID=A0ABV0XEY1_9TELE
MHVFLVLDEKKTYRLLITPLNTPRVFIGSFKVSPLMTTTNQHPWLRPPSGTPPFDRVSSRPTGSPAHLSKSLMEGCIYSLFSVSTTQISQVPEPHLNMEKQLLVFMLH